MTLRRCNVGERRLVSTVAAGIRLPAAGPQTLDWTDLTPWRIDVGAARRPI